ncbi:MAG: flagellar type III secretion system pore protein FliP [Minwuiales bacterium]|nr:flagellar type III secretion system pore protein FliP [Minwuiales bacterium]
MSAARMAWVAGLAAIVAALSAMPAAAQQLSLDLGGVGDEFTGRVVQIILLMTVLSLAPAILVVMTSFTRIVVVLSLLRSALGVQQTPPNVVIVSLSLFLTAFVMAPTFEAAYSTGIAPLIEQEITQDEAFERTMAPLHSFMRQQVREKDLLLFVDIAQVDTTNLEAEELPLRALIPAFMISELRRAFEIGFLIFVPFLVIDMVVASVLMSMGMMMLPPIIISLPFKLIFFVLVDGWNLVAESLVQSFGASGS